MKQWQSTVLVGLMMSGSFLLAVVLGRRGLGQKILSLSLILGR